MTEETKSPAAPGKLFTIIEAAAKLRISRRNLQDLLHRAPHYALNGNRKLFSEEHIAKLFDAMCQPVRDAHPFFAFTASRPKPPTDAGDPYAGLRRLTAKKPRRRRP